MKDSGGSSIRSTFTPNASTTSVPITNTFSPDVAGVLDCEYSNQNDGENDSENDSENDGENDGETAKNEGSLEDENVGVGQKQNGHLLSTLIAPNVIIDEVGVTSISLAWCLSAEDFPATPTTKVCLVPNLRNSCVR